MRSLYQRASATVTRQADNPLAKPTAEITIWEAADPKSTGR